MKRYLIILIFMPLFISCNQHTEKNTSNDLENINSENVKEQNTTYYLIRHAEKDRTNPEDQDPSLNIEGLKRAKRWATYFEPFQIDQIYTTKYIRNKQTISMIAQQKAINPTLYDPHNIQIDEFLKETNGKNVLIVGHSNTIPTLVNALIGKEEFKDMEDDDNSTLFKVTLNGNDKKVETITVE